MNTLPNVETGRGQYNPPSVRGLQSIEATTGRLAPETIPEATCSQARVSVRYVPTPGKKWFVYTTEEKASEYVKNTPPISFLSYYYNHFELDEARKNPPLTIPEREMENFILATCNQSEHLLLVSPRHVHYRDNETVRVTDGLFKGAEGMVARGVGTAASSHHIIASRTCLDRIHSYGFHTGSLKI